MACTVQTLPPVVATGGVTPGVAASPGFMYGRAGDFATGTYFQVIATVPSNVAGNIVPFDGIITRAFITNEAVNTFSIQIQKRVGAGYSNLGSVLALVADRKIEFGSLSISVSDGDEIAVTVASGSGRNGQVGLIIEQS
jgi:hypothetical protein